MSRETDKEAKRFKIYIERDIVQEPEWWGGSFEELVVELFAQKIVWTGTTALSTNVCRSTTWKKVERRKK